MGNVQHSSGVTLPPSNELPVLRDRHGIIMSELEIEHCRNYYKEWLECVKQYRNTKCEQQRAHLFGICADALIEEMDKHNKDTLRNYNFERK